MSGDVLERLLPEADAELAGRARRLTTFLRLVDTEARSLSAESVGTSVGRARAELERDCARACAQVVGDLAIHHLDHALGASSFLSLPRPELPPRRAWARLEQLRSSGRELPHPAAPGESAHRVGERMVAALSALDGGGLRTRRARACLALIESGPAAAVRAFRLLERGPDPLAKLAGRIGRVELCLEAGDVRGAERLLSERGRWAAVAGELGGVRLAERAATLDGWVAILSGRRALQLPRGQASLPAGLLELRRRCPALAGGLPGRGRRRGDRPERLPPRADWRRGYGARLLAVFRLAGPGELELVELDLERSLHRRAMPKAFLNQRLRAEVEAVAAGRPWYWHRGHGPAPVTVEGSASALAWPIGVPGCSDLHWVWMEFGHHLLPSANRLKALGQAVGQLVSQPVKTGRTAGAAHPPGVVASSPGPGGGGLVAGAEWPAVGATFQAALEGLGAELHGRRWWGLWGTADCLSVAAAGAQWPPLDAPGGGRASRIERSVGEGLLRALRLGRALRLDGPLPGLGDPLSGAPAPDSGRAPVLTSAIVPVPLGAGLSPSWFGAIAMESPRRGDFGRTWLERLEARLGASRYDFHTANFRDWHLARFGGQLWFGSRSAEDFWGRVRRAAAASARGEVVAIFGLPGSGKTVASRWVCFERNGGGEPFESLTCGEATSWAQLVRAARRAAGGALCLERVERLAPRHRARLLGEGSLAAPLKAAGLVVTLESANLRESLETGLMGASAARAMEGSCIAVPSLSARRADVPRVAELSLLAAAKGTGRAMPMLEDAAKAWLWRQDWPGNLRQLDGLMRRCAASPESESIGVERIERLGRAQGLGAAQRTEPRKASIELIRSALDASRGVGRRVHLRRAALYLGWHPDTLSSRCRALGIGR